jgi:hypothetical protein
MRRHAGTDAPAADSVPLAVGADADRLLVARIESVQGERRQVRAVSRAAVKERDDWRGRRRFEYVQVEWEAGPATQVFLKGVDGAKTHWGGLEREAYVYESLLPNGPPGPPRYLGRLDDDHTDLHAILLEWVSGSRLKNRLQVGAWRAVARWLARFHTSFSGTGEEQPDMRDALRRWDTVTLLEPARRAYREVDRKSGTAARILRPVLDDYARVVAVLAAAPPTLLHGEFYCTNVLLVGEPEAPDRVCPFDWETAAVGCGAVDVACLARQKLGLENEILEAYGAELDEIGGLPPGGVATLEAQHHAAWVHEQLEILWRAIRHRNVGPEKLVLYAREIAAGMERVP